MRCRTSTWEQVERFYQRLLAEDGWAFVKIRLIAALSATAVVGAVSAQTLATDVPQVVAPSNPDKDWQPSEAQRERAVRDALAYLAAKDEGRFSDAYALFTPTQKAVVPFDRWEAHMRAMHREAGAAQGRTLKKVTWYKSPVNGPQGTYAAVDFSSQFAELALHCGFVALQLQMDGSFAVAREEENAIHKREMARLSADALQKVRAQYRC